MHQSYFEVQWMIPTDLLPKVMLKIYRICMMPRT
nr:MAG TPA: hypothetical protein [Caudoviricetes sp.]DAY56482.1 MAG TPA: hypothetical protein [Caudoviricetes sp.]